MWGVFTQGDFGTTFQGRPVLDIIEQGLPVTVTLAVVALCFQIVIGIIDRRTGCSGLSKMLTAGRVTFQPRLLRRRFSHGGKYF